MSYVPDLIDWFRSKGQWYDRNVTPLPGAYIMFDWDGDDTADHVGLVEYVQDGQIGTIGWCHIIVDISKCLPKKNRLIKVPTTAS